MDDLFLRKKTRGKSLLNGTVAKSNMAAELETRPIQKEVDQEEVTGILDFIGEWLLSKPIYCTGYG